MRLDKRRVGGEYPFLRDADNRLSGTASGFGTRRLLRPDARHCNADASLGLRAEILVSTEASSLIGAGIFMSDTCRRFQGKDQKE